MDLTYNKVDQTALPVSNTRVSANEYNQIAGSLMSIISASGLTPDSADNTQLLNALKVIGSGWAMPSSSYDNLTVGASGTYYTAPANGFFCATGSGTSNSMWIELVTNNDGLRNGIYGTVNWNYKVYLPVRKGAQVQLNYNAINFDFFRFYYAVGAESEAN